MTRLCREALGSDLEVPVTAHPSRTIVLYLFASLHAVAAAFVPRDLYNFMAGKKKKERKENV